MSNFFRWTGRSILGPLPHLWNDRRGVTAIEYGLIASLIAVVIVVVVTTTGANLLNLYNGMAGGVQNAASTN